MRVFNYILVLLVGYISFTGCVKEDRSDCPPDVTGSVEGRILHFKTWPEKYVFEQQVESVLIYLYDKEDRDNDGILVEKAEVSKNRLIQNDYQVNLDDLFNMSAANYHVVAIMNMADDYEIVGEDQLDKFAASFLTTNNATDSIYHRISDVFLGDIALSSVQTKATVRDTVDLLKLTNHIYLTVEFDDYTFPAGHNLETHVSGTNASYNYKKESIGTSSLMYAPHAKVVDDSSIFNFDITTGQLWIGDDLKLRIEEYGPTGVLYRDVSFMLTEEISKLKDTQGNYLYNTTEKLRQEDEFYLHLILNSDFSIVRITINNWFAVRPGVDL